jgi:hypothetical protein
MIAPPKAFAGPPVNCRSCGGALRKERKATSEGSGCLIIVVGALLAPFLIGIPLIIYGLHLMSKCEGSWRCVRCHATYPRKIGWFEFG